MEKITEEYITILRKNKIILEPGFDVLPKNYISSLLKEMEYFGYTFSKNVIDVLYTYSIEKITSFYKEIINILTQITGDLKYKPFYPNFPKQVMDMDGAELYLNAILHYFGDWIGIRIIPKYKKDTRFCLLDKNKLIVIDLGSKKELHEIFTNIMSSKTSISNTDKEHLKWYIKKYHKIIEYPQINHKEVLAFIGSQLINLNILLDIDSAYITFS